MGNIKWLGALFVLIATTWIGSLFSQQLNERPRQIRQLIDALTILEAEMLYSQLPLQVAFLRISKRIQEPLHSFFHSLSDKFFVENKDFVKLWDEQLQQLIIEAHLNDVDYEILHQFGQTLGQHDYDQQEKNIRLTISYLQRQREEAIEQARRYSKLANVLGLLLGLLIVLLLF